MSRKLISQLLAISAGSLATFSCGMTMGFPAILIPELSKADSKIVVTLEELNWIASLNFFFQPVGVILSGLTSRCLGRRSIIILSTIPCTIAWLSLSFSGQTIWPITMAFTLLGITNGLTVGPNVVYILEISESRLRGINATIIALALVIGNFAPILAGSFLNWRTLALVNVIIPVSAFVALFLVPESPYWLARKGRINESKSALAWLRGWTTIENISIEFSSILEVLKPKAPEANNIKSMIRRYFRRSVLSPLALLSFVFGTSAINGAIPIIILAVPIFNINDSPINEYMAFVISAGLQVLGAILMLFLVPWMGKRKTILASISLSGISMLGVVIYILLTNQKIIDQIQSSQKSWIPTSFLGLSIFATSFGIKCIPWVMVGEVFPGDVRVEVTGTAVAISGIFTAIADKFLLWIINFMTLSMTFLMFAIVNLVGMMILYYIMPETEGRSLAEIERYFEGCVEAGEHDSWRRIKNSDTILD